MSTPTDASATNAGLLYLSQSEVASLGVTITEIIDAVEKMFEEKAAGRVEMPPKPGIHPQPDAFIHAMPAYIPAMKSAGIKWVSGFPENYQRGLPYVSGLIVLNNAETGLPLAVMDCVWITAQRTAAASAVGAKYLARPDAGTVGILGCGVQGRSHLPALHTLFPLRRVMAYDTDATARESYASSMSEELDLEVVAVDEPRQAVTGCDIVVTAGPILKVPHATIQSGWLDSGSFAALVRSSTSIVRRATSRTSHRSMPSSPRWWPERDPDGRMPTSGPSPATSASLSRTSWWPHLSTGAPSTDR
jgi:ornithine cyclodeaminase/alanine dehydrogenase